jgi:hypothetical protein
MDDWLEEAAERLATDVGDDRGRYRLADGDVARVLDLAGVAAREGGHRTNAPLLCFLAELAQRRHPDLGPNQAISAAIGERTPA